MADDYAVAARVACDWVFGSSTVLLLRIGRVEERRWRRIYRALRDAEQRRQGAQRCSNWLRALPDGPALAVVVGEGALGVRSNFAGAQLAAGTRVAAQLQPRAHLGDDGVLRFRLMVVDLRPRTPQLSAAAPPFYPPPPGEPPDEPPAYSG